MWVAVVAAAAGSLHLALHAIDARRLERANQLGLAGSYEEAMAEARRAGRPPARTRALQVEAVALGALGRHGEAVDAWARVVRREPNSWVTWLGFARSLAFAGDADGARAALLRAKRLNPRLRVPDELRAVAD